MKPIFLGIIITIYCAAQTPFTTAEKGRISGTVTNVAADSLRRVTLRLTPIPARPSSSTETRGYGAAANTDQQGNLVFDEVAPGRYSLVASRAGFLSAIYSTARSSRLAPERAIARMRNLQLFGERIPAWRRHVAIFRLAQCATSRWR